MVSTSFLEHIDVFVGIDVSKEWLDVYLRPLHTWIQCDNHSSGFKELDDWLRSHGAEPSKTVICMENTGIYDDRLLKTLAEYGWICAVEKTSVLKTITPDHHRKDDRFDAAALAEYADRYQDKLTLWDTPDDKVELLRQLYSERRRLVTQKGAVKAKSSQSAQLILTSSVVEESWNRQMEFYQQQIAQLEARMHQIVANHPGLNHYWDLLMGVPGIGKVTTWLWLIKFYGQKKLDCKKIASRFGFAPHSNRSGSSIRGKTRSSGHGFSQMRQYMSLAAQSASTYYDQFKNYKQRKLEEGKQWPVVRNNLINKLIKIICAIWNSGQSYRSDHTSRFDRQKKSICT